MEVGGPAHSSALHLDCFSAAGGHSWAAATKASPSPAGAGHITTQPGPPEATDLAPPGEEPQIAPLWYRKKKHLKPHHGTNCGSNRGGQPPSGPGCPAGMRPQPRGHRAAPNPPEGARLPQAAGPAFPPGGASIRDISPLACVHTIPRRSWCLINIYRMHEHMDE